VRELLYKAPCQKTCKERDFVTLCSLLKKPKKGEELMQSSLSKKHEKREVELLLLGERYCNLFP
jgi:hypothetical protein